MKLRRQQVTAFCRSLICAAALAGPMVSRAANVTLINSDAVGSSSFNSALNWSNGQAPTNIHNYSTGAFGLRTPVSTNSFTFQGASLTINTNGNLNYKGSGSAGIIAVNNLVLNGGTIIHNSSPSDVFWLYGNLNIAADSWIYAKQGYLAIVAPISGNGKITNPGSDGGTCTIYIFNSLNTYTGSVVNNGRFYLVSGANFNFVIGAAGVNNSISGTGPEAFFDGRFVFNLSGASTNMGDSWTIASASGQSFGSNFSVDGFTRQGGGPGSGKWDYGASGLYYEFDTASGLLSVVAEPSTNAPPGPPGLTGVKVTYIPIDDGDTNTSEYGYAGDSDDQINAVAFIGSGLMTVSNQQFITYYGRHQTDPSYTFNNRIWIGRRTVGSNLWEVFRTTLAANDITDGHDVISFGIDGDGHMHMSWGMHGGTFNYRKSTMSVIGTNTIAFGATNTMTGAENNVTYPQFLTMPNGDLLFIFRQGTSGAGDTFINRYTHTTQTWTNQQFSGVQRPFVKGTWPGGSLADYNCYPNLPCLDANGNLFFIWTWRTTSAYQSNHDFAYAHSADGGLTWQRSDNSAYTLPISQYGESNAPNTLAEIILAIPENSSLINQAGMCLDGNNNPVIATWWAPGTPTNNFRRQYMVAFPDSNGVWQTRQISNRTNDPTGTLQSEGAVRDLGRPVVVADKDNRIIVLYRDNFGRNGLTVAHSLPYAVDPLRTNWTTLDLTTDNLGSYESVIDLARWEMDNVLDILYQPCTGHGYTAPANTAAPIAVLEWDAAAYFNHVPTLHMTFTNANQNVALSWRSQTGWGYQLQTSTNLPLWDVLATLNGNEDTLQYVHTNAAAVPARFWRLRVREGGF